MMIILNPTEWPITVKWNGLDHVFDSDERKPVEDPMGKQIIHNYQQRGLVSLVYGDEGEIELGKAKKGRAACDAFWTKQCVNYNQDNTRRQESNRTFVEATEEVAFHAKRLGIKMLEPYKLEDTSSKQIALLIEQNASLKKEIDKKDDSMTGLQAQVAELTENFKKLMSLASPQAPEGDNGDKAMDPEIIKATYYKMSRKRFVHWIVDNWEEIESYPDDVKDGIAVKHENLFQIPLPKGKPAIETYDV